MGRKEKCNERGQIWYLSKGRHVLQSLKWLLEVTPLCYHPKQFVAFTREIKEWCSFRRLRVQGFNHLCNMMVTQMGNHQMVKGLTIYVICVAYTRNDKIMQHIPMFLYPGSWHWTPILCIPLDGHATHHLLHYLEVNSTWQAITW